MYEYFQNNERKTMDTFFAIEHRSLQPFFDPKTIAVIGSNESGGKILQKNLLETPRDRQIYSIAPESPIPEGVDLAIISTPAVIPSIRRCVEKNVKGALILSTGLTQNQEREIQEITRGKLRFIGPNSSGLIVPTIDLNASLFPIAPKTGNLAFISQSGAIASAVLDWSLTENVGFSAFISLGSPLDIDWGDLLYYLGDDLATKSIVIYLETIADPRSFLSAAREVSLSKPIVAIRRKTPASAIAAVSHAGRLVGSELALEAAFDRCGIIEVQRIADLFNITEVLAKQPRLPKGPRLSIVANGAGPAVLATDALILTGGELAKFSEETIARLSSLCPPRNPIDLRRDAGVEDYRRALEIALGDGNTDGVLVILTPRIGINPVETARAILPVAVGAKKTVLASWMGGDGIAEAEAILNHHGIATYRYPDSAASLFNLLWKYGYNLRAIYETPVFAGETPIDRARVTGIIDGARSENRTILTEPESNQLLNAYGIPIVTAEIARDGESAVQIADSIGYPVAVKVLSNTIVHKNAVGGVMLHITDPDGVRQAYRSIRARVDEADFLGVSVQPMILLHEGYELFLGCSHDPRFGPVLLFGIGGEFVEISGDRSVALPPLNTTLARRFIEGTRVSKILSSIAIENLERLIARFSQLTVEQPWIKAIDINPLFVDSEGIPIVISASIILHSNDTPSDRLSRPAIRPYPSQYIDTWTTKKGINVTIRPIRAEDEPLLKDFYTILSEETIYFRYFHLVNLTRQSAYDRLTRECFIDYDRVITLIAKYRNPETGKSVMLGLGRLNKLHGVNEGEFDLLIGDFYQGQGLGTELLQRLVAIGRAEGLHKIRAEILQENRSMQKVAAKAGFLLQRTPDFVKAVLKISL
jgi:acetyltransferase